VKFDLYTSLLYVHVYAYIHIYIYKHTHIYPASNVSKNLSHYSTRMHFSYKLRQHSLERSLSLQRACKWMHHRKTDSGYYLRKGLAIYYILARSPWELHSVCVCVCVCVCVFVYMCVCVLHAFVWCVKSRDVFLIVVYIFIRTTCETCIWQSSMASESPEIVIQPLVRPTVYRFSYSISRVLEREGSRIRDTIHDNRDAISLLPIYFLLLLLRFNITESPTMRRRLACSDWIDPQERDMENNYIEYT